MINDFFTPLLYWIIPMIFLHTFFSWASIRTMCESHKVDSNDLVCGGVLGIILCLIWPITLMFMLSFVITKRIFKVNLPTTK